MTHKDIFTKFMIEYDKANVTSSYPSLTEYEIATFLDKAYLALIAQKVTGNNVRRAPFEADAKSVFDLQPLVTSKLLYFNPGDTEITIDDVYYDGEGNSIAEKTTIEVTDKKSRNPMPPGKKGSYTYKDAEDKTWIGNGRMRNRSLPDNVRSTKLPDNMLYFVSAVTAVDTQKIAGVMNDDSFGEILDVETQNLIKPMDNKQSDYNKGYLKRYRAVPVQLVSHQMAQKFFATAYNIPWVKTPVCYIEGNYIYVVADPIVGLAEIGFFDPDEGITGPKVAGNYAERLSLTYIKTPNPFVIQELFTGDSFAESPNNTTYATERAEFIATLDNTWTEEEKTAAWESRVAEHKSQWSFELNDVAAEELISLAISYALENVESSRLNAHLGMRGLES